MNAIRQSRRGLRYPQCLQERSQYPLRALGVAAIRHLKCRIPDVTPKTHNRYLIDA